MKNKAFEYDTERYPNWIDPKEITPYPKNAKLHPPEQVSRIVNSITRFGWQQDVVLDKNGVCVIGHGRRLAALEIGCKVPYHTIDKDRDEITDEDIKALRVADNKVAESDWDFGALEAELAELEMEFDMSEFGFDEIPGRVYTDTSTIEDDEYDGDAPTEPKAKLGQIYQLGQHRLMCGSSTDEDNVAALMNGERAAMLFTSPPYSDMREYEGGKDLSVDNLARFIAVYRPYVDYQCVNLGIQRKNNDVYQYWDEYIRIARDSGYKMLSWNVWDKGMTGNIGQAAAFFPLRHEWVFVFGTEFYEINLTMEKKPDSITDNPGRKTKRNKDGSTEVHTTGDTSQPYKQMESVLFMHPELSNYVRSLHPATFPIGLPGEYIKAMTQKNDIVIEPFGGSGTTLIACEQTGRRCRIMELEPKYVDVIIARWEKFTGEKAVLLNG